MKIVLYIEDGLERIVLTPESDTEKSILNKLHGGRSLSIKQGQFYECRGGWVRHSPYEEGDRSTMIILRSEEKA